MSWVKLGQDLDGVENGGRFGGAVSIAADGTIVAIGIPAANTSNGNDTGEVRVFKYNNNTWVQYGNSINGLVSNDEFGSSVSISNDGTVVAIGAPYASTNNSGQVRVYKFITDTWVQQGANINGEIANENFGVSVTLSSDGTTVAISAMNSIVAGNTRGSVRIYKFINDVWEQQGMTINGEGVNDQSGTSISISNDGTVVAIGAPLADGISSNAGHVRIYKFINGAWSQQGADIDGEYAGDKSGTSVSLSGDGSTVAIGAISNEAAGLHSGHVRIYKFINGTWTQQGADIDGEAASDQSGTSVSISNDGSVVAIGALLNDADGAATNAGHVRVYKLINGTWVQQGLDIDGEAAGDQAGRVSLSEDGTTVAIGATNHSGTGHVRVYKFFTEHQNQLGQDIGIEAGVEQFVKAISLSADGTTVAIGAADRAYTNVSSRVRVYKLIGGTWTQQGLDINEEIIEVGLGQSLSLSLSSDGTTVAIGASYNDGNGATSDHVRIYKFINGTWTQQGADIDGEAAGDMAGWAVSLSADGTTVAIGAPYNDGNGNNVGHVRVYKLINGIWIQQGADIEGTVPNIQFGSSVSLSANGTTVAIGAPLPIIDAYGNITAGQYVSVYKLIGGNWAKQGLDINSEGGEDSTGHSVSLSANGETVAIGAPFTSVNGMQSGQVRVYTFINDNWVKKGEDIDGEAVAEEIGEFISLSADGNTVAVNVNIYDSSLFGAGGARIYTFINGTWAKKGIDIFPKSDDAGFGESVTLSANGSTVAIGGAYSNTLDGFVRVYTYTKYFTPVLSETVVIERNASTSTNNIVVSLGYDSSIQGEDINANIERIECMLQRRYTELTTWETLTSYTLTRSAAGDWVTSTNLTQPLGGKARIVYTIVPVATSSYLATTFVSPPFAFVPFECNVSIFGVNTIKITPTNPVTGQVYAHNLSVFNSNAQSISLTSTVPGFAYNAETSEGVVPEAYCSNPYSIGGISFTASNDYNIQITTQVTGRGIKYRYITSLLIPSTIQSITTLSDLTDLSLNTITSLATNDPTLVPSLSGITNGLLNSTLSASISQPTGSAKTSVDASLKLVARAQAAANPTAPITAMTVPNANLRAINSAGLFGRTAIVVAAVPPSNTGSARNCVLTPEQEIYLRNGLFYIAGETDESLRLISQDALRSVLFEFPGTGQVRVDGTMRAIGEQFVTSMGRLILNFSGSAGGSGANAICFLADAPILTPSGYRPIHTLQVGDPVRTAAGRVVVVKRTFAKEYEPSAAVNPYVIPKGMFGALRALPISPNHEVMVSGKGMIKAKDLGLPRMKMTGPFTYYNLELEDWVRDNLVVAGVECESLAPAERIVMSKAEFLRFVKVRYGPSAATRLRSVCFEESDGRISLPALR